MIAIAFNLAAKTAKLTAAKIAAAGEVPIRIEFDGAPGDASAFSLTLGSQGADPAVLAYTDLFVKEDETLWTALLAADDTRLVAALVGKGTLTVVVELRCVLDGALIIARDMTLTVEPAVLSEPAGSEGGPHYTRLQMLSADTTRTNTTALAALTELNVALAANARYHIEFQLYLTFAGTGGEKLGFSWPAAPGALDGFFEGQGQINGSLTDAFMSAAPDWPTNIGASGFAMIDEPTTMLGDFFAWHFVFDVTNGPTAGNFSLLLAQHTATANALTLRKNSNVQWRRLP